MGLSLEHATQLHAVMARFEAGLTRLQEQVISGTGSLVDDPEAIVHVMDSVNAASSILEDL